METKTFFDEYAKQFNIEIENLYDGSSLKNIPNEWKHELIKYMMEKSNIEIVSSHFNDSHVIINFPSNEKCKEFETYIETHFFENLYELIISKNLNPKEYNRCMTFVTKDSDSEYVINF